MVTIFTNDSSKINDIYIMTFSKLYSGPIVLEEKIVLNVLYRLPVHFDNYAMQKFKWFDFDTISF